MFLARSERPDFRTINDLRKNDAEDPAGILTQTIEVSIRENLIDLRQVCIDGTKIGASAGRRSFKTPATLKLRKKKTTSTKTMTARVHCRSRCTTRKR
jgi:transposase